ncbi:unnamed protein product (macronuclear) [Paramecium tetraurelia]|uniref:Uncharacterized protein n=1 Tax=Paramecium tetraurelia TaxID=5888 RepID=A0BQS4_PARTE|nr:uncharacterized protein GSPATT00031120001 [Paramecium tetraurelia]CAK60891.1 unnamed protein product [Paramecium tetraurelia]|eukprot:XP_001428289.1 hypothetical protein (macronuclear) [Paramecium tetraurelia strain d4-2]
MEQNTKVNSEYFKKLKLIQKKMENIKADQSPSVIKYMLRRKSAEEVQAPLHDVEFNQQPKKKKLLFFKTFQKVVIDPITKLDEINEEKWAIMSNNYKSLIEKSRQSLSKHSQMMQAPLQTKEHQKIQFLTRRQSIEFRLREITTAPSNHSSISPIKINTNVQLADPNYDRFKKYYQKIGIVADNPAQMKFKKLMSTPMAPQKRKEKSQHSSNNSQQYSSSPPKSRTIHLKPNRNSQYLQEIKELCSVASNYQAHVKQDERIQIHQTSKQMGYIQAEFNKFHNMLTTDLERLDFYDEKK